MPPEGPGPLRLQPCSPSNELSPQLGSQTPGWKRIQEERDQKRMPGAWALGPQRPGAQGSWATLVLDKDGINRVVPGHVWPSGLCWHLRLGPFPRLPCPEGRFPMHAGTSNVTVRRVPVAQGDAKQEEARDLGPHCTGCRLLTAQKQGVLRPGGCAAVGRDKTLNCQRTWRLWRRLPEGSEGLSESQTQTSLYFTSRTPTVTGHLQASSLPPLPSGLEASATH